MNENVTSTVWKRKSRVGKRELETPGARTLQYYVVWSVSLIEKVFKQGLRVNEGVDHGEKIIGDNILSQESGREEQQWRIWAK